jgi:mRNA-degrading endonuclease RelE of RelBE toxin-antitoxin system
MKYDVYLSPRAKKQYKRFDAHIRHKIRTELLELEEDPSEKGSLQPPEFCILSMELSLIYLLFLLIYYC